LCHTAEDQCVAGLFSPAVEEDADNNVVAAAATCKKNFNGFPLYTENAFSDGFCANVAWTWNKNTAMYDGAITEFAA